MTAPNLPRPPRAARRRRIASIAAGALAAAAIVVVGCDRSGGSGRPAASPASGSEPASPPAAASRPADSAAPAVRLSLVCDAPQFDFGPIAEGEVREHSFPLENRGPAPVTLNTVSTQCGCTVASIVRADGEKIVPPGNGTAVPGGLLTLAPGGKCDVVVSFNSRNQPAGAIHKATTVMSSDPTSQSLTLTFSAEVQRAFRAEPATVQFGELRRGEEKTQRVMIRSDRVPEFSVTGIDSAPAWIAWKTERTPDGVALDLSLKADAPCGLQQQNLVVTTRDAKFHSLTVPVYATIVSRIRFDTGNPENRERIDFGLIDPGKSATRTVDVTNDDPRVPCHVLSADVDSPAASQFTTRVETVTEGAHYRIVIESTPTGKNRTLRGVLRITTDHPDLPKRELPLQAWVRSAP